MILPNCKQYSEHTLDSLDIDSMICKHSSYFLACLFTLLVNSFEVKVFNFNEVQLTLISFTACVLGIMKYLANLMT